MSKLIRMTDEKYEEIKAEFYEKLHGVKLSDGEVSFKKSLSCDEKATLIFSEGAWVKMQALITTYDKEVAWHGIARRGEDTDKNDYIITDIIVYPQKVTGSTVDTDQEKYEQWLMSQDDDIFNNIRMQGHSHVNMGVSPSSVDNTLYEKMFDMFKDDTFYIFMIWNKRKDKFIKIYDMAKNILFETEDITVEVEKSDRGILNFLDEAKEMVEERSYTTYTSSNSYPWNSNTNKDTPSNIADRNGNETAFTDTKKNKKRKGKRVKKDTSKSSFWHTYYSDDIFDK